MCTAPPDTFVCEFHQLSQDRKERVKEFAGRIEKLPERYPDKGLLKDRLFYGMNQHLCDSLRFMFQDPKCDYTNLLKAASAAEIECERGRGLGLHSKGGSILEVRTSDEGSKTRDTSPIKSSVASMEFKIDQLMTIVKSVQKLDGQKNNLGKSPKQTPKKSDGPTTSAAGLFKKGKRPLQCWHCGGWGHTSRECPTQGNLNWRELNRSKDPPAQIVTQDLPQTPK